MFPNITALWINSYFPTDSQTLQFDNTELVGLLEEAERIMDTNEFDHVIWSGDFNFDPRRQSGFAITVSSFLERIGLVSVWDKFPVSHTHTHTDLTSTSILDHFMVDHALLVVVEDAGAPDLGDNLLRHCPIVLKLKLGELPVRKTTPNEKKIRRPAWYKASDQQKLNLIDSLYNKFLQLQVPDSLFCQDQHCTDSQHSRDRDDLAMNLMGSLIESSHQTIPMTGGGKMETVEVQNRSYLVGKNLLNLVARIQCSGTLSGKVVEYHIRTPFGNPDSVR